MTSLPRFRRGRPGESLRRGLTLGAAYILILAGGVGLARAESLPAEGQVGVWVASGRHFIAEVDRRTDAATLWLRWGQGSSVILRPIAMGPGRPGGDRRPDVSGDIVRRAVV